MVSGFMQERGEARPAPRWAELFAMACVVSCGAFVGFLMARTATEPAPPRFEVQAIQGVTVQLPLVFEHGDAESARLDRKRTPWLFLGIALGALASAALFWVARSCSRRWHLRRTASVARR